MRRLYHLAQLLSTTFEVVESTAYICRTISHYVTQALAPFFTTSILALVALALFAASIYMILGRIIRLLHAEHRSLIKVGRLTKIFVLSDVLSFQVQSAGAAILASKMRGTVHTGQILIIVALLM